jgi:hypothetical protein
VLASLSMTILLNSKKLRSVSRRHRVASDLFSLFSQPRLHLDRFLPCSLAALTAPASSLQPPASRTSNRQFLELESPVMHRKQRIGNFLIGKFRQIFRSACRQTRSFDFPRSFDASCSAAEPHLKRLAISGHFATHTKHNTSQFLSENSWIVSLLPVSRFAAFLWFVPPHYAGWTSPRTSRSHRPKLTIFESPELAIGRAAAPEPGSLPCR